MMLMLLFSFEPLIIACLVVLCSNYHHISKQANKKKSVGFPYNHSLQQFLSFAVNKMNQNASRTVSVQNGMIM